MNSYVSGTGASTVRERIEVYDFVNSRYELISEMPAKVGTGAGDLTDTIVPLKDDPAKYKSGSNLVRARITFYSTTGANEWTAHAHTVAIRHI